jgi:hypothetical protein
MKFAAYMIACLVSFPLVAAAQVDITGPWEVTLNAPTGPTTVDVTFKQEGEAITGELVSPLGAAGFKGTLVKDTLTVNAAVDVQGNQLVLAFTGKVANDAMTGNVKFGDFGEAAWTAKRKAAGAAPAAATAAAPPAAPAPAPAAAGGEPGSIAGKWDIQVAVPGNPLPFTGVFKQDGAAVTGTITSSQGEVPVTGTMTGNTLTMGFSGPGGMTVTMTGELQGSTISGKTAIAGLGEMEWTGKRSNGP